MSEHWTVEEYRRFQETGRMPEKKKPVKRFTAADAQRAAAEAKEPEMRVTDEINSWPDGVSLAEAMTEAMKKSVFGGQKQRKYRNEPVTVDGIRFDSKHEATIYQELMLRVKAGELKCVCRQVKFDLGGGPYASKNTQYVYVADFVTIDRENRAEVIDAKSAITRKNRTYIDKKKRMLACWGLEIQEV